MFRLSSQPAGPEVHPTETPPSFVYDLSGTQLPTLISLRAAQRPHPTSSFANVNVAHERSVASASSTEDAPESRVAREEGPSGCDRRKMTVPGREGLLRLERNDSPSSFVSSQGLSSDRSSLPSKRSSRTSICSKLSVQSRDTKTVEPDLTATEEVLSTSTIISPSAKNTSAPSAQLETPMVKIAAQLGKPLPPIPQSNVIYISATRRARSYEKFPVSSYSMNELDGCRARPVSTISTKKSPRRGHTPRALSKSSTMSKRGVRFEKVTAQGSSEVRPPVPTPIDPDWITVLSPTSPSTTSTTREVPERVTDISPSTVEKVIFDILRHLDDPRDLVSAARINKSFYTTFKKNEPLLAEAVIFNMSPAAYEYQLACLTPVCQWISLQSYTRDKATIDQLKPALYAASASFLEPEKIAHLSEPSVIRRIDDALWRIWTYCTLFRHRAQDRRTFRAQVHWLNGGRGRRCRKDASRRYCGTGNGRGLSKSELEDMSELWNCLSLTLSSMFHHREVEAGVAGVFDDCEVDLEHAEAWYLNEWVQDIIAHGPAVVLSLLSTPTYELARSIGLLNWSPPTSMTDTKSTFLSAPVTHVYHERVMREATAKAAQHAPPVGATQRLSRSGADWTQFVAKTKKLPSRKSRPSPLKIRTSICHAPKSSLSSFSQHSRSSIQKTPTEYLRRASWQREEMPNISAQRLAALDTKSKSQIEVFLEKEVYSASTQQRRPPSATSCSRGPAVGHALSPTSTASNKLGATLFPAEFSTAPERVPISPAASVPEQQARSVHQHKISVVDPVDKAIALLTQEMGFSLADAKHALARSDTGEGLDVQAAVEMLALENKLPKSTKAVELASEPVTGDHAKKEHSTCQPTRSSSRSPPPSPRSSRRNSLSQLGRKISRTKAYTVLGMKKDEVNTFEKPTYVAMSMTVPIVMAADEQQQQSPRRLRKLGSLMGMLEEAYYHSMPDQRASMPVARQVYPAPMLGKNQRHPGSTQHLKGIVEEIPPTWAAETSSKHRLTRTGSQVFDEERRGSARKAAQMLGIDAVHLASMGLGKEKNTSKRRWSKTKRSSTAPATMQSRRDA